MATAVLVPVADLSPLVDRFRATFDRSAAWGVPPHVTILYPFVPDLSASVLARLAAAVSSVAAFDVSFDSVRWFRDELAWVAPNPSAPFRALIDAAWAAFPDYPPYEGAEPDPTPHVTIGHSADVAALRAAAAAVSAGLPIRCRVGSVAVMTGLDAPRSWRTVATLPLTEA
jgi:2'-5' RNA ligase